jgi:hypothetical protein
MSSTSKANLVLGIVFVLSTLIYAMLVHRLYLPDIYTRGRIDNIYFYRDKPYNQVRLLVAFLVLGISYIWGWWAARKASQAGPNKITWILVIGGALACTLVLLFLYPVDAADIFDNIVHGRILGVYGENPFVKTGRQFSNDPFYEYMAWDKSPSAYGPLWESLAGITARLSGDELVTAVIAFKLLPGVFWLASLVVVGLFLYRNAPQETLAGVYLLAWNPNVLFSTWGNGHNDIVLVFCILLAAWALVESHFTTAILLLLLGALVKYVPLLLIPAAVLISLNDIQRTKPGWGPLLRFLALTAMAGAILVWLAYRPFWVGLETLSIQRRTTLFTASLPAAIYHILKPTLGKDGAGEWVSGIAAGLTFLFVLWRSWRIRNDRSWTSFTSASFDILIFYLLVTCLWFQHWYAVWLVGIAAVLPFGGRQRLAMFISLASMGKRLIVTPALFKPKPLYPQPGLEIRFALGVMGLSWLYSLGIYLPSNRLKRSFHHLDP